MNPWQRQQVTPELRDWILAQASEGQAEADTLRTLVASGWRQEVALEAIESTLPARCPPGPARGRARPRPVVPEPNLAGAPASLVLDGRSVPVLLALRDPRVVVFDEVLSDDECDALIEMARPRMARSLTVAARTGAEEVNVDRTSTGMFFRRAENELIARIERRVAELVNWPVDHGEGLQVLHYGRGAEYKPHYDYFDPDEPGTASMLRRGGQRLATVILYLCGPEQGGATVFPDVGLEVRPRRGGAVFFSYAQADPSSRTLHGGAPVTAGEKWIATKWLRERRFE